MKKRILVILAFGVSFAPAVFAYDTSHKTGELPFGEIMNTSPEGVACNRKADKTLVEAPVNALPSNTQSRAGSAR